MADKLVAINTSDPHGEQFNQVVNDEILYLVGQLGGVTGPAGPAGPAGPPGAAATVAVGPTTTGAPGTNAAVVNTGSPQAAVFAFTVPAGATGAAGKDGAPGADGAPGKDGVDGAPGTPGKDGADGAAGADGVDGVSLSIQGAVPTYADLPADAVAGDCYVVEADGLLYDFDGTGFPPDGAGVPWVGKQGIQGQPGIQGAPGLGITFKGQVAVQSDLDALSATAAQGDLYVVNDPAPAHGFVWDAATSAWVDAGPVQGPQGVPGVQGIPGADGAPGKDSTVPGPKGDPGPSAVSKDAGNVSVIGSDNLIYTPASSSYVLPVATKTVLGGVKVGTGLGVAADGTVSTVPQAPTIATNASLGEVQIGDGVDVTAAGVIAVPVASATVRGSVKVGTGITVTADGTISSSGTAYTLPAATATVLGGVKQGTGVTIAADGTLSASGGSSVTNPVAGSVAGMTIWTGTQAAYDAIATKNALTVYHITG